MSCCVISSTSPIYQKLSKLSFYHSCFFDFHSSYDLSLNDKTFFKSFFCLCTLRTKKVIGVKKFCPQGTVSKYLFSVTVISSLFFIYKSHAKVLYICVSYWLLAHESRDHGAGFMPFLAHIHNFARFLKLSKFRK